MTEAIATRRLTADEARDLTDEVKADAAALWRKLLRLYEGDAHLALGFKSWGAYFAKEFGQTGARGYQLLDAARVLDAVESHSTTVERPTERVARELAPLLDGGPEAVAEAWQEAVEQHGPTPTAREVCEVVTAPADSGLTGVGLGGRRRQPPTMVDAIAEHDDAWSSFHTARIENDTDAMRTALARVRRAVDKLARHF